jgi:hypothetical protein
MSCDNLDKVQELYKNLYKQWDKPEIKSLWKLIKKNKKESKFLDDPENFKLNDKNIDPKNLQELSKLYKKIYKTYDCERNLLNLILELIDNKKKLEMKESKKNNTKKDNNKSPKNSKINNSIFKSGIEELKGLIKPAQIKVGVTIDKSKTINEIKETNNTKLLKANNTKIKEEIYKEPIKLDEPKKVQETEVKKEETKILELKKDKDKDKDKDKGKNEKKKDKTTNSDSDKTCVDKTNYTDSKCNEQRQKYGSNLDLRCRCGNEPFDNKSTEWNCWNKCKHGFCQSNQGQWHKDCPNCKSSYSSYSSYGIYGRSSYDKKHYECYHHICKINGRESYECRQYCDKDSDTINQKKKKEITDQVKREWNEPKINPSTKKIYTKNERQHEIDNQILNKYNEYLKNVEDGTEQKYSNEAEPICNDKYDKTQYSTTKAVRTQSAIKSGQKGQVCHIGSDGKPTGVNCGPLVQCTTCDALETKWRKGDVLFSMEFNPAWNIDNNDDVLYLY